MILFNVWSVDFVAFALLFCLQFTIVAYGFKGKPRSTAVIHGDSVEQVMPHLEGDSELVQEKHHKLP